MIIYKDLISEDELLSDTYKITDITGTGLWEVDLSMVEEGGDDFKLEGANASAEGEDADDTEASAKVRVINLVRDFRLQFVESKPDKKAYTKEIKKYMKAVLTKLKEKGKPEDEQKEFQSSAANGIKKILANYDNYDLYVGESMDFDAMFVLIDYREDGVTPYATIWKHALTEMKLYGMRNFTSGP